MRVMMWELSDSEVKAVLGARRRERRCLWCGHSMPGRRADAVTCRDSCRARVSRAGRAGKWPIGV